MDKKTLGVTAGNDETLSTLMSAGAFNSEIDAAKFAMSLAIQRGVAVGVTEGAGTKWNVGSLDPDQSLKSIIEAIYPDVREPYRLVEYFMNEGLRLLGTKEGPPDVLTLLEPTPSPACGPKALTWPDA